MASQLIAPEPPFAERILLLLHVQLGAGRAHQE